MTPDMLHLTRLFHSQLPTWICRQSIIFVLLATMVMACSPSQAVSAQAIQSFTLKDHLGLVWEHELVSFPLNETSASISSEQMQLIGPSGHPVPFQQVQLQGKPAIAFHANVPELGIAVYQLIKAPAKTPDSSVNVQQANSTIRMTNGQTGIALAADPSLAANGPVVNILMPDGSWAGQSKLSGEQSIQSYTARVTASGPVYAEVVCLYKFTNGSEWELTYRLAAAEPVVIVSEQMTGITEEHTWSFTFPAKASPTNLLYRAGADERVKPARTLQDPLIMEKLGRNARRTSWRMVPWVHWWQHDNAAAFQLMQLPADLRLDSVVNEQQQLALDWFVYQGQGEQQAADVKIPSILLAAGQAGKWSAPGLQGKNHHVMLTSQEDGSFTITMPLNWPGRRWLIGTTTETRTTFLNSDLDTASAMLNKHLNRPLDYIKDLVLDWPHDPKVTYPNIFPTEERLDEMRKQGIEIGWDSQRTRAEVKKAILHPEKYPDIVQGFAEEAVTGSMRRAAGFFLNAASSNSVYGRNAAIGSSPHQIGRAIESAAMSADRALGYGNLTEQQASLLRARLALTAYYVAGDDSVSPERGFAQLENMTAMMYGGLGLIASVIPDHPESRKWAARTAETYEKSLQQWAGPKGGWIEAPHYQLASLNSMLMFGLATAKSGISDFVYDERIKQSVLFLAKICTPRDPRHENYRHIPAIGNTYLNEPSDIFALMASIYKDRDPEFAAHMQWMWEQQGKPTILVIGGDVSINWINSFHYRDIQPKQPKWKSELFPFFGAVLRDRYSEKDETYMVYHHGEAGGHYDVDQGSFEMWGLGQPLMLDWGYSGRMLAWQHNTASFSRNGRIKTFATADFGDYVQAQQDGWDRDIVMVRSPGNDGDSYFVVQDRVGSVKVDKRWPAAIWYWFNTTKTPRLDQQTVRVVGPNGVSLDVWLDPQSASMIPMYKADDWQKHLASNTGESDGDATGKPVKTHIETIEAWEGRHKAYWKRGSTTQHGLSIPAEAGRTVTAILYPRQTIATPATIEQLENGKVLKITRNNGVDYVFLAAESTEMKAPGGIRFTGRSAIVQVRDDAVYLTLLDGSSLQYGEAVTNKTGVSHKFPR